MSDANKVKNKFKKHPVNIAEGLLKLTVPISSLRLDPNNARLHPDASIRAIADSFVRFKQQKPIVVTKKGLIIAGNGMYEAAKRLGWDRIAAVRTSLTGAELKAFGVVDNRAAELSVWDQDILRQNIRDAMKASESLDRKWLETLAYGANEIKQFIDDAEQASRVDTAARLQSMTYNVTVKCKNEAEQAKLATRLEKEGYTCQLSML